MQRGGAGHLFRALEAQLQEIDSGQEVFTAAEQDGQMHFISSSPCAQFPSLFLKFFSSSVLPLPLYFAACG